MKNPFQISTKVNRWKATVPDQDGKYSRKTIHLTDDQADDVINARALKKPVVLIGDREYHTRDVLLQKIDPSDEYGAKGELRWTEEGPHAVQFIDGEQRGIWIFRVLEGIPVLAEKVVETYLGYFHSVSGKIIRITEAK